MLFKSQCRKSMTQDEARQRDAEYLSFCSGIIRTLWVGILALAGAGGFFLNAASNGDDKSKATAIAILSFIISAKLVISLIGAMLTFWAAASLLEGFMQSITSTMISYLIMAGFFAAATLFYSIKFVVPDIVSLLSIARNFQY